MRKFETGILTCVSCAYSIKKGHLVPTTTANSMMGIEKARGRKKTLPKLMAAMNPPKIGPKRKPTPKVDSSTPA